MQISLRLFLLAFASIVVGAMLSGQRRPPQQPGNRGTASAISRGIERTADAAFGQNGNEKGDPESLLPLAEPVDLSPATIVPTVSPAAHSTASTERNNSKQPLIIAIAEAVRKAELSLYEISVSEPENGVVVLEGLVDTAEHRLAAARVARQVQGVARIVNRIKIMERGARPDKVLRQPAVIPAAHTTEPGERRIPNQALAEAVAKALSRAKLSHYEIDIDVRSGVVTLQGRAANFQQRVAAEEAVSRVAGVARVVNRITIADRAAQPNSEPRPNGGTFDSKMADLLESLIPVPVPVSVVKQVALTGNQSIPEWVLKLQIRTKVKTLWLSDGNFDPSTPDEDVHALKQYYQDLGYFDVQVKHSFTLSEDQTKARIEFIIEEGTRSQVRDIEFTGNEALSESQLREMLQLQPGDDYDQRIIAADRDKIVARYRKIGSKYPRVEPRTRSFEEPGVVDLIYEINEDRQSSGAASSEGARNISRLAFHGVATFDLTHIRQALVDDFDLIGAALPEVPLDQYLDKLRTTIESGYRHGGFPDATIAASYRAEHNRIEVRIQEGRRYRCGDVYVTSAQAVPADALIRALTEDPKPTRIRWKKGGPVPFDDETAAEMRKLLEVAFEEAGFYRPDFEIRIDKRPDGDTASLTVIVHDAGPRAVLGQIQMKGLARNSNVEVLNYLEVEPGMPFDRQLPSRLERRLSESGRFLAATVAPGSVSEDATGKRQIHDLVISMREYEAVPPLSAPLSPAEEALLKLREWLQRWARGEIEEDIVVSGQAPLTIMNAIWDCFRQGQLPAGTTPTQTAPESRLVLRMIVAPRRGGQTISLQQNRPDGSCISETVFAAYSDRLVLASPQRKAKLVLPNSAEDRLYLSIVGKAASRVDTDSPFRINLGTGWSNRPVPDPSPFEVRLDFSAVFMLGRAHYNDMHCVLRDGTYHIRNEHFELQIDAATGRPVEFRIPYDADNVSLTVCAETRALNAELARLEGPLAASAASYDSASPWKSRLDFAVDELLFAAEQSELADGIESLRALHKLIHLWSPPAIADLLEPAFRPIPETDDTFRLPTQRAGWSMGRCLETGSQSQKLMIARSILPVYRRLVPTTGPLWPVGRDLALQWGSDHVTPAERLWDPKLTVDMRPAIQLLLQLLDERVNSLLAAFVSRESLQCLELAAIGHGCEPFLTGDSWSSQWLLSLATAVRGLDELELQRVLAILISDDVFRSALLESLDLLRKSPDAPIDEVLPKVLDRLWISILQAQDQSASTGQRSQPLPTADSVKDDLEFFPSGPERKLIEQVQTLGEYKRREQAKQSAKD